MRHASAALPQSSRGACVPQGAAPFSYPWGRVAQLAGVALLGAIMLLPAKEKGGTR